MGQNNDLYSTNNFVVTTASTDINQNLNEPYGDSNFHWASGEQGEDDFFSMDGDYSNAKGKRKSRNKAGGYADRRDKRVNSMAEARKLKAQAKLEEAKAKTILAKESGKDDGTRNLLSQSMASAPPTDVSLADSGMPSAKTIYIGLGVVALLGVAYFGFGKQLGIRKENDHEKTRKHKDEQVDCDWFNHCINFGYWVLHRKEKRRPKNIDVRWLVYWFGCIARRYC